MKTLQRPQAVLLKDRCHRSIKSMKNKADENGAEFRPHFKTHQSHEVGRWFRQHGISGITVSSPEMAAYFVDDGWNDITVAFPLYEGQIQALNRLSERVSLRLFVNSREELLAIEQGINHPVSVMIEIDSGYNRSGIHGSKQKQVKSLVEEIGKFDSINFAGFYAHDGATYQAQGKKEVSDVVKRNLDSFNILKADYPQANFCIGDTPSCSLLDDLSPANELTPGNVIFYDLMQVNIGSCDFDDVGLLVKVPVAQRKPESDECIIHGGAVHFSKDRITYNGAISFGQPVYFDEHNKIVPIEGSSVTALSQEHGTVNGLSNVEKAYGVDKLQELYICPVHSCLTANLFKQYHTPEGEIISKRVLS